MKLKKFIGVAQLLVGCLLLAISLAALVAVILPLLITTGLPILLGAFLVYLGVGNVWGPSGYNPHE